MTDTANNPVDEMQVQVTSPELLQEQLRNPPTFNKKPLRYALVHYRGAMDAPPCGGIAFWYLVPPVKGVKLDPRNVRFQDGSMPVEGAPFVCDTCKVPISVNGLQPYERKDKSKAKAQRKARKRNRS